MGFLRISYSLLSNSNCNIVQLRIGQKLRLQREDVVASKKLLNCNKTFKKLRLFQYAFEQMFGIME